MGRIDAPGGDRTQGVRREYRLTSTVARELDLDELVRELQECFEQKERRKPSEEEKKDLLEAVEWIKGGLAAWRTFERGVDDETWDPAEGARSVFGGSH